VKNLHIAIIFSLVCAGCIIIPVPIPEQTSDASRAPIGEESLGFLEVGSTKREEVLLTLGLPDSTQDHERVIIYEWNTKSEVVWLIATYGGGTGTIKDTTYTTYQLLIEFDDIGIVKRLKRNEEETDLG
jgi:outer membrane protein assembly factor BamE (lipoprotein component of BamABCDE complex)